MAKLKDVGWGRDAQDQADGTVEQFKADLRRIAIRLARHDRAETVDTKHVRSAFESLVRFGLESTPWWKRPQAKVTGAGLLLAFALAMPDWYPQVRPEDWSKLVEDVVFWTTTFVSTLLAVLLYVWAWCQNRM